MEELPSLASNAKETLQQVDEILVRLKEIRDSLPQAAPNPAPSSEAALVAVAKALIRARRSRTEAFGIDLFADPTWDGLLELYVAQSEGRALSVSEFCAAMNAPVSSAIRYLKQMTKSGLLVRADDPVDARRVYVRLSSHTHRAMTEHLDRMAREIQLAPLSALSSEKSGLPGLG